MRRIDLIFDKNIYQWDESRLYNECFLKSIKDRLNTLFKIKGHLTLREAANDFGFDGDKLNANYGWVKGKHDLDISIEELSKNVWRVIFDCYII